MAAASSVRTISSALPQQDPLALGEGYQQFYDRGLNSKITSDVVLRVGQPVSLYYGYISDGVYNNSNELANGPFGSNGTLGELKVVDINGNGQIDANDRVPIANVNPTTSKLQNLKTATYDLCGRKANPAHGITITQGRKQLSALSQP